MKKTYLLLSSILLICSCSNGGTSSQDSFVVDDNTVYQSNTWDEKVNKVVEYIVKDAIDSVPTCTASEYKAFIEVTKQENTTIKCAHVYCYSVNGNANEDYSTKLANNGYVSSSEGDYSYFKASSVDDVYSYYDLHKQIDGSYLLDISFYRVTSRYEDWDTSLFSDYLGFSLPKIEAESYEYYYSPSMGTNYPSYLSVYANVVEDNALETYKKVLTSSGFTISSSDSYYYYLYKIDDNDITINIAESYTAYNEKALFIKVSNAWPYLETISVLNKSLPKITSGATYSGYEDTAYLAIYYDYATLETYQSYISELTTGGFKLTAEDDLANPGSYESSNPSIGTTYYAYYENGLSVFYYSKPASIFIIINL
jgi:hypothetical protein